MQAIKVETRVEKEEEEWQRLVEMIRQSKPRFLTLDEAMDFSRERSWFFVKPLDMGNLRL